MKGKTLFIFCWIGLAFCLHSEGAEPELISRFLIPINEKCHTQGMDITGGNLYVSCVNRKAQRAYLYEISLSDLSGYREDAGGSVSIRKKDLTRGDRYHPSGLDARGECLWVAVAEYHPAPASSTLMCVDPETLEPEPELRFEVDDHIGAVAASDDRIFGANWDARSFYVWDWSGKELGRGPSPTEVAYQDCKYIAPRYLLCTGTKSLLGLIPTRGILDLIEIKGDDVSEWNLRQRVILKKPGLSGPALTREASCYADGKFYFLPRDLPRPTLYEYRIESLDIELP